MPHQIYTLTFVYIFICTLTFLILHRYVNVSAFIRYGCHAPQNICVNVCFCFHKYVNVILLLADLLTFFKYTR